jgi:ACS family glucarate transporter-like MFS transporter
LIAIMSIAFFGKGVAALGWTMVSDIAPRNMIGATGGLFNMVSASSGVLTPLVMGYVVHASGSFNWAVVYVAAHGLLGMAAFALLIRRIERIEM